MRSLLAIATLTAACTDDPCTQGAGVAELGTGESVFEPLADGADLPFVRGPQGGWHVLGSVRVRGLTIPRELSTPPEDLPVVRFELLDEGGTAIAGYTDLPRFFREAIDWEAQLVGELVQFFEDPTTKVGTAARLEVAVCDLAGELATDARNVVLRDGS